MAVGEGGRDNGVKALINTTTALGNKTIDLSHKGLTEIPSEVLDLQQLEFLYLEGNYITEIPSYLFERLPSLKWLDLRNNHINEVPSAIGSHKALRNLLLEGNDLKELPLELGFAKLSGLNIASNPLEMPPSSVIERGTQEVLKYLREKYASKMQLSEQEAALNLRPASRSSSDEDIRYYDHQIAVHLPEEEKVPTYEEDVSVEKVRLPPIFQAAAERARNRTVDESHEILRGQKSTQFEPKAKINVQISEPDVRTSPKRYDEGRRMHSPPKKPSLSPDEGSYKRLNYTTKHKKSSDSAFRGSFKIQVHVEQMEERTEKTRKKRKSRGQSPTKVVNHPSKKQEKHILDSSPDNDNHLPNEGKEREIREITAKTERMKVEDEKYETEASNGNTASKQPQELKNTANSIELPNKPTALHLKEGDFVAIKVPSKLYIKGQPCLGKITTMADNLGLLTVHYYTGTYEGYWRPMMSRTSPYLRKMPHHSVLCKFKLSNDGRMSPITRAKVKKIVDGEER